MGFLKGGETYNRPAHTNRLIRRCMTRACSGLTVLTVGGVLFSLFSSQKHMIVANVA